MSFDRRIGIIAGGGSLPYLIAENNKDAYIVRLEPFWNDMKLLQFTGMNSRIDKIGFIMRGLKRQDITDVVFVGNVARPKISSLRPDATTWAILGKILVSLISRGDDALLRGIRNAFETRGFAVHGIQDLVQGLMAPKGLLTKKEPDDAALRDIDRGIEAARDHGAMDKGQAIVVQHGRILDVEGRDGTDALIKRCAAFKTPGPGPVLVKTAKPGQDRAMDMPTIGPETVQNAVSAGFAGIAVEAGSTILADKFRLIELADQHGLFMIGVE
ncbi:MAG TPA: UDP-2,3-diacylglucosamine diphosphatase LpxI [Alphaproteobacteria bacterium]